MLSSAVSYASSKEKKEWRTEGGGMGGDKGEKRSEWEWGRASAANQWTAVGQAEATWEQRGAI